MSSETPAGTSDTAAAGQSRRETREQSLAMPHTPREFANMLLAGWPFAEGTWAELASAATPVRVEELVQDGQVIVRAELPGLDPAKDIEVVVDEGVLTIKAERHEQKEDRTSTGYRSEFRYGSLVRQVRLPTGTTGEVVSATYKDGVLEVRMPAPAPRAGARRIDVERG